MRVRLVYFSRVVFISFISIEFATVAKASSLFDSSFNDNLFNPDVNLPLIPDTVSLDQPTLPFYDQSEASLSDVAADGVPLNFDVAYADVPLNFNVASSIEDDQAPSLF